MISTNYHNPVLLVESVEGLNIIEDGIYVDATYGGGGHSREILSRLGEKGQLIAFDQDFDSKANLIDDNRLLFINENFMYLKKFLKLNNISKLDGILADFGVSSYQIDKPERGFSYRCNIQCPAGNMAIPSIFQCNLSNPRHTSKKQVLLYLRDVDFFFRVVTLCFNQKVCISPQNIILGNKIFPFSIPKGSPRLIDINLIRPEITLVFK